MLWDGISEFVAVAEKNSFTLASQQLGISTAQVSRQITALEKRLNTKLFYRTTRKVSLTEEGQIFYQHCRGVLDGLEVAERALTNLQATPQGTIKLTAPVTYGEQQILPLINNFIQLYPEVEVTAFLTNQKMDLVENGFDLAIRIGNLADSTLIAKKLSQRSNYVCAAPSYIAKQGMPHSLSELEQHSCLMGTNDYWRFIDSGKERNIRLNGRLRYNSGVALADAALKGLGIVQLPNYYLQEHIDSGQLITLLDNYKIPNETIWALYPHNRQLSAKIRLLIDYLARELIE